MPSSTYFLVRSATDGPVVLGPHGMRRLADDATVQAGSVAGLWRNFRREGARSRLSNVPARSYLGIPLEEDGISVERLHHATGVDPWFLCEIGLITAELARMAIPPSAE